MADCSCDVAVNFTTTDTNVNFSITDETVNFQSQILQSDFTSQDFNIGFTSSTVNVNFQGQYVYLSNTNYLGSNCSGSDGDLNRTLTKAKVKMIVVDNQFLHPSINYTYSANVITFLQPIWNSQNITIFTQ